MFLNVFILLLFFGGFLMKFTPVFINANDLGFFASSDAFGLALILVILVSTVLCIILGRGRS